MKTPNLNQNNQNNQNTNDRYEATQVSIQEANNRALQARDEAFALRQKLEAMESLLAVTKTKLALTKETLVMKDERLKEVRTQTAMITQSLNGLDERFANLKVLQGVLAEKRDKLFPPDAPSTSEESTVEATEAKEEAFEVKTQEIVQESFPITQTNEERNVPDIPNTEETSSKPLSASDSGKEVLIEKTPDAPEVPSVPSQ